MDESVPISAKMRMPTRMPTRKRKNQFEREGGPHADIGMCPGAPPLEGEVPRGHVRVGTCIDMCVHMCVDVCMCMDMCPDADRVPFEAGVPAARSAASHIGYNILVMA